ncbi:MAG: hypothetical protein MNPFHGCM_02357 [Gemmatimonadaceae bacterium]|nr:hypothetical protein [Gemmatimonadaceae bacterium]
MAYLLDADVFIRAKNLHYGFDFCPAFWEFVERNGNGAVFSVVVTHEVPAASPRKIKIPDACIGLGIKCMTPYEMLRVERARFVLGASGAR